jgi:hypothetical protein
MAILPKLILPFNSISKSQLTFLQKVKNSSYISYINLMNLEQSTKQNNLEKSKLEDSQFMILKLTTKLQQSRVCGAATDR